MTSNLWANSRFSRSFGVRSVFSLVFIHLCVFVSLGGDLPTVNRVFVIERSKNANQVCYDLNIDSRGNLNADKPLKVYWLNRTDRPGAMDNLSLIQAKYAYGYSSKSLGNGDYEITLVAFPERKLRLEKGSDGRYRAIISIAGVRAQLTRIFVQSEPGNYTKVAWVDLYGISLNSGKEVSERIIAR
ncbi:MAG TPA: DUF4833 domain-containing protein [Bacteroidales bacterium]|nr:DUF4833 domain-containing protein [Bacteroidales bacterium]MDI9573452.1 DUF4833 domain-containing protein [Bacteroidota bacterium]MBP9587676.1 DUF4833 domain-containing protein [Bacteroidales bacterium]HNQ59696.1 DUF4833 domain-containing protein [Bacteroidales bacterium]HNU21322.1 DUF4833 domain-containing protein [Bacteroidales bacterium]